MELLTQAYLIRDTISSSPTGVTELQKAMVKAVKQEKKHAARWPSTQTCNPNKHLCGEREGLVRGQSMGTGLKGSITAMQQCTVAHGSISINQRQSNSCAAISFHVLRLLSDLYHSANGNR